jgi:hypothetical protein
MMSGTPGQKYLLVELVVGFSTALHGSQVSSWREPDATFRFASTLPYFAWLLSFPIWGLMWMGYSVVYTSLRNVPSHCVGQCCFRQPF